MVSWLESLTPDQVVGVGALSWPVVFLGKTLYSQNASLHPGVYMVTGEFNVGGGGVG